MTDFIKDDKTGYLISKNLLKIKEKEFELYEEFKRVCEKYSLKFFAIYGTLLGAVRHNNMIPWDDDMDFAMLREDFDKLCSISKDEFNGKFFFQTGVNDHNYFFGYARLRNIETTGIIRWFSKHPHVEGIYIDIFVFDKAPFDKKKLKKMMKNIRKYHFLLNNYFHINTTGLKKIVFFAPLKIIKLFLKYDKLYDKFISECTKYNSSDSDIYFLASCPTPYELNWFYEREINELIQVTFGSTTTFIPNGYKELLTRRYGNFMELPPEEERGMWHNNIIIFDPDISYREYEIIHNDEFKRLNKEYLFEEKKRRK